MRGAPLRLVQLDAGEYLLDALVKAGLCGWSPMGDPEPLSWLDLWAFGQATRDVSEPWEYEALAEMSRAFVAGLVLGRNEFSDPPYAGADDGH